MEDIYVQSLMLDQYGELLTQKQRDILQMYLSEDLSLGEIGQILGISRQGVSDSIHRSLSILEKTENKLHIAHRSRRIAQLIDEAADMIHQQRPGEEIVLVLDKIRELALSGEE
ncbi:MAG: DNA-binding protein [Firmicutes bacterium]|nr:DNA-binding protein [Bacillota bacterium]